MQLVWTGGISGSESRFKRKRTLTGLFELGNIQWGTRGVCERPDRPLGQNARPMIEPISDLPGNVLGYRVSDELTDADYADVLAPALRGAAAAGEVRLLLVATKGFDLGSFKSRFEDLRNDPELDLGHSKDWKRVAVAADANFIFRAAFPAVAKMIPVETKLFGLGDEDEARAWVAG
jgi:hypothetical protein